MTEKGVGSRPAVQDRAGSDTPGGAGVEGARRRSPTRRTEGRGCSLPRRSCLGIRTSPSSIHSGHGGGHIPPL